MITNCTNLSIYQEIYILNFEVLQVTLLKFIATKKFAEESRRCEIVSLEIFKE